jgi:hypothetical protein
MGVSEGEVVTMRNSIISQNMASDDEPITVEQMLRRFGHNHTVEILAYIAGTREYRFRRGDRMYALVRELEADVLNDAGWRIQ